MVSATSNVKAAMQHFQGTQKNQRNMTLAKDSNNLQLTNPKDMDLCNLPGKEFKIAL